MYFSKKFVSATTERTTLTKNVPAPYLRRDFVLRDHDVIKKAEITVCGLGFYRIFVNGTEITKGHLSPYLVIPDHNVYYDNYDILPYIKYGNNTIGFMLGNGIQNGFDAATWHFDRNPHVSAPKLAFALEMTYNDEEKPRLIEADQNVLTHPSPIYFDGLRMGEKYDSRLENPLWNLPGADLSDWTPAIPVRSECGEPMLADCHPIVKVKELKAVNIIKDGDSYVYDFGQNLTGLTRLNVSGTWGQHINIDHSERPMENGHFMKLTNRWDWCYQVTDFICNGTKKQSYRPSFTYYGFRYAKVTGITEEQATPDLLVFDVMNTELTGRTSFKCSDPILNQLFECTLNSTTSNFIHFPNDCPHREKNGWTGDAALSALHTMLNFDPEDNYVTWLRSIVRAIKPNGAVPGIVPNGDWSIYHEARPGNTYNGPAWDNVLVALPYYMAVLRDDLRGAEIVAPFLIRYLMYINTKADERGLVDFGLWDYVHITLVNSTVPATFTDNAFVYDFAVKSAYLYRRLGMENEALYCDRFAADFLKKIRKYLLTDEKTMTFYEGDQTAQAYAIYFNLCVNEDEKQRAFNTLLERVHADGDKINHGVLGGRVFYRVMLDYGQVDLIHKMIVREDGPSYGYKMRRGMTTLPEDLAIFENDSLNHHFWGDISAVLIEYYAGIRTNKENEDSHSIHISPIFPTEITFAEAEANLNAGLVKTRWDKQSDGTVELKLDIPEGKTAEITAPGGYLVNGKTALTGKSGTYTFTKA